MSILAASFGNDAISKGVKAVILQQAKGGFALKSASRMSVRDINSAKKANEFAFTFDYNDFLTEEAELPPIVDKRSLNYLIKGKVQDLIRPDVDYTFLIHDAVLPSDVSDTAPDTSSLIPGMKGLRKKFTIYGVPSNFTKSYGLADSFGTKLKLTTLDHFSLVSLSKAFDSTGLVCHAFADESHIVISFSIGRDLVYARSTYIPDGLQSKEELITFYNETINLTYMYIKQSRQRDADTIILSGRLHNSQEVAAAVLAFSGKSVSYLTPERFVKNCSAAQFHEYLLPIAVALTDDYSNFISLLDKEARAFKEVLLLVNIALFLLVLGAVGFAAFQFMKYTALENAIIRDAQALERDLNTLDAEVATPDDLYFTDTYIAYLRLRDNAPVNTIVMAQEFLSDERYNKIDFYTTEINMVDVAREETLGTYTSTYQYQLDFNKQTVDYELMVPEASTDNTASVLAIPSKTYTIKTRLTKNEPEQLF